MSQAQYTDQIVRLIEQQGQQQAAAADRKGQIWGGALANIGQIPLQVQQQKQAQQQQTLRSQEIAIRGQELDQRTKQFAQELIDKKQAHDDAAIAQIGSFIHESGNTVEALQSGLQSAKAAGLLNDAEIAPILAGAQEDPNRVKLLARGMMARTKEGRDRLEKVTKYGPGEVGVGFEGTPVYKAPPAPPKTQAELAADAANPNSPTQPQSTTALDLLKPPKAEPPAKSLQSENVLLDGKPAKVNFNPASGVYQLPDGTDVSSRVKPLPPASVQYPKPDDVAPELTASGLDITAENYAKTGQLPPMGMGKAGAAVRAKIINRAAELHPEMDLAANRAGYGSDTASLKKMQAQRDAIGSFEQTAMKNIDIFLDTAGKVIDTGSPLANTFIRAASAKILGSPDQAKYDAARQVAVNEIAKITTNPNLSGALSDSARHEVEAYNPNNATLKQTVAVMRLLKQDMANRTKAMDDQIAEIKGRIGGGKTETAAPKSDPLGLFGPKK